MNARLAKQLLYGAGYLAIFSLIVFIIYLIWLKPAPTCFDNRQNQGETGIDCGGPCSPCEIKTLSPFEVIQIKHFPADNQAMIAVELKNPNLNWGADRFSYNLVIYDQNGQPIKNLIKNSFIYAAEIKYLLEPIEVDSKNIGDIKISFSDINWKSAQEFPEPLLQLREIKIKPANKESGAALSGFITNNNPYVLSRVKIIGFLFNQSGLEAGASKTELENLGAFEEKFFKINFPKNILNINPHQIKTYAEAIR